MPKHVLLDSQRAQVFEIIKEQGFDPRDFELTNVVYPRARDDVKPILRYRSRKDFYFLFAMDGGHWVSYSPGGDRPVESSRHGPWDEIVPGYLEEWLSNLRREIETPDVWGELERERELLAAVPPAAEEANTPFSPSEQAAIASQLREIKESVRANHELTEGQFQELESRLDYLEGAAARLPRFDWREALKGVLLGLAVEAVVPPEVIRHALVLSLRGLAHLFGGEIPQLPA